MNDSTFDVSRLSITNGLSSGYRKKKQNVQIKAIVTLMTFGALVYVITNHLF